jgi:hypothetical protein
MVKDMNEAVLVKERLREASSLPELLAVSFDAFEVIRLLARRSQDRVPGLFAAFMSAADAAVDGREAVTIAPSLPVPDASTTAPGEPAANADLGEVIDALAALGGLLDARLTRAAVAAAGPTDRAACEDAADAARRIRQLMARDDDDTRLR